MIIAFIGFSPLVSLDCTVADSAPMCEFFDFGRMTAFYEKVKNVKADLAAVLV
jgi:hypothetical protein